jgi:hypothetical protein
VQKDKTAFQYVPFSKDNIGQFVLIYDKEDSFWNAQLFKEEIFGLKKKIRDCSVDFCSNRGISTKTKETLIMLRMYTLTYF